MPLYRLIYFSRRTVASRAAPITDILHAALMRNTAADITGALVFDKRWFVQIIEGSRAHVAERFMRVAQAPCHTSIEIVWACYIHERRFASVAMAGLDLAAQPADIVRRFTNGITFDPTLITAEGLMRLAEMAIRTGEIVVLDGGGPDDLDDVSDHQRCVPAPFA